MIWFFVLLNFGISWLNAWGCGRTWAETKMVGGWQHFMNWMGAIMSASGFTWCYLVVVGTIANIIPVEMEKGSGLYEPLLSDGNLQAFYALGYLVIILPILGSGLAIMLESWAHFWRRRTFRSGAVAGWNTFANAYNYYQAAQGIPAALEKVGELFKGGGKDSDSKGKGTVIVVALVALAVLGGILTTASIIRATMTRMIRVRREQAAEELGPAPEQPEFGRRWSSSRGR